MQSHDAPLTELLQLVARGERGAMGRVFSALYPDLRRIARARLRSRNHIAQLDATGLVHESFLRLVDAADLALVDRKHFFTYAAKTMRNIVVGYAREQCSQRRGGGRRPLQLDLALASNLPAPDEETSLIAINDALSALEAIDPQLAQIVEMRYFAGYSEAEIADLTGSSERTVRRQWEKARTFLMATLME